MADGQDGSAGAMTTYFIDESGHTGDLLTGINDMSFAGQPDFVLAGVGCTDREALASILDRMVSKHRIQATEVKSKTLQSKPWFALDLLRHVIDAGFPVFVEGVNKRFYIAVAIVNCMVMPPTAGTFGAEGDQFVRNAFAAFLSAHLPDALLQGFLSACGSESVDAVRDCMVALRDWAAGHEPDDNSDRPVVSGLAESLTESIDDLDRATDGDPEKVRVFLPVPDTGKGGTTYWLLPNFSSLTNLYARINRYHGKAVAGLTLVHDEQAQYDDIFRAAKAGTEVVGGVEPVAVASDYVFTEAATLVFGKSKETPGLMVADVIAGQVRRFLLDFQAGKDIQDDTWTFMAALWTEDWARPGPGINLVVADPVFEGVQAGVFQRFHAGAR